MDADASLEDKLKRRIRAEGPLSFADYMAACLGDPDHGYYRTGDPLGAEGDFVTAPEVSQIFGELVGLWCVQVWRSMGGPSPFRLVELGPGRGTLMSDALRAARLVPEFLAAADVHLVEINATLREAQDRALNDAGVPLRWHADLDRVPPGPTILVANEFIDALPVRQFQYRDGRWQERGVGLDRSGEFRFAFSEASEAALDLIPRAVRERAAEGVVAEVRPGAGRFLEALAARAGGHPMTALIIDYGHLESAPGDTVQAVRAHAFADPLTETGRSDLTAHVDFANLCREAEAAGLDVSGPISQARFLLSLGLAERLERLSAAASAHQARDLAIGARRLVAPDQMGELFKVIAISSRDAPAPPPFDASHAHAVDRPIGASNDRSPDA